VACVSCGSKNSKSMKHLPFPEGRNSWVELSEWTDYCKDCAEKEAIKMEKIYGKTMEGIKNGTVS
jgi:hypothetical protein